MRGKLKITKEDKEWAIKVKERDEYKCAICGEREKPCAHHLIPREIKKTRFMVSNGITLCPLHHRFSRQISAHQNPIAFIMWMEENRPNQLYDVKFEIRCMAEEVS